MRKADVSRTTGETDIKVSLIWTAHARPTLKREQGF